MLFFLWSVSYHPTRGYLSFCHPIDRTNANSYGEKGIGIKKGSDRQPLRWCVNGKRGKIHETLRYRVGLPSVPLKNTEPKSNRAFPERVGSDIYICRVIYCTCIQEVSRRCLTLHTNPPSQDRNEICTSPRIIPPCWGNVSLLSCYRDSPCVSLFK